jgi:hypothetical protein
MFSRQDDRETYSFDSLSITNLGRCCGAFIILLDRPYLMSFQQGKIINQDGTAVDLDNPPDDKLFEFQ